MTNYEYKMIQELKDSRMFHMVLTICEMRLMLPSIDPWIHSARTLPTAVTVYWPEPAREDVPGKAVEQGGQHGEAAGEHHHGAGGGAGGQGVSNGCVVSTSVPYERAREFE